ncbi:outer membrane protein [Cognatiyoonia sp. IB215182]|uniref:outer membrane protein n=1 Tax=Cognatiyoonia sp. IB215182 TaxID=3097353 RepID=UPI002A1423A9|nr:outer membrane beta-barrel protein [Cognatiyoonia sp. IB215182]MDX8354039.1 outer membrane beta-barrel protein [Cognatiyoonia sp. IB215182]
MNKSAIFALMGLIPTAGLADFSGAYGGLSINSVSGTTTFGDELLVFGDTELGLGIKEDTAFGGFGGYQIQSGNFVYGGEIALTSAADGGLAGIQIEGLDTLTTDIKGRVGYVLNDRVMAYGTAGFSRVDVDLGSLDAQEDLEADGFIIGVGLDYLATDSIVLGAEFTNRQVDGSVADTIFAEELDVELDVQSLALRAAFKF